MRPLLLLWIPETFELFIDLLLQLSEAIVPWRLHVELKRVEVASRDLAHELVGLAGLSIEHRLDLLFEEAQVGLGDVEDLGEEGGADDVGVGGFVVIEDLVGVVPGEVEAES